MKHFLCYITLIFTICSASAQIPDYMSLKKIMDKGDSELRYAENQGHTTMHMEYDLVFKDSPRIIEVQLYAGKTFVFRAFAEDEKISDLDIAVFQDMGEEFELVAKDVANTADCKLTYSPTVTGTYKVKVVGHSFLNSYTAGRYGLLVYW